MKAILLTVITAFSFSTFAKDVAPRAFHVWYQVDHTNGPYILFNFTVNARDFATPVFSELNAVMVSEDDSTRVFAKQSDVLSKARDAAVRGYKTLAISIAGQESLPLMGDLATMRIVFVDEAGADVFSVNIADLCKTQPDSFEAVGIGAAGCP